MLNKYNTFTVMLPDSEKATPIAMRLAEVADTVFTHDSGRPWIMTRQLNKNAVLNIKSPHHITIIGSADTNSEQLHCLTSKIQNPHQLKLINQEIAGSYLVFGSINGTLYANGPAFQSKRIFTATINGIQILSDRADLLADLGDFTINTTKLALRMIRGLPHPADGLPVWNDIIPLPGWEYITVSVDGVTSHTHRWWHRPAPTLDRHDAALKLRKALKQCVRARTINHTAITCDLSGGLDSTPVCYFASTLSDQTYAHTYYTKDPGGLEDLNWAKRALEGMPNLKEHQAFSNENMPDFFENLTDVLVPMDFPSAASGTVPRLVHMLNKDKELGTTMHLNGIGGDHLFRGVKIWNHTIVRENPIVGWKRARAEDIPDGVGILRTISELSSRTSYSQWLKQSIDSAFEKHSTKIIPRTSDWSVPISAPEWIDNQTAASAKEFLHELALTATPFDTTHAGHFDIQTILDATSLTRAMEQAGHHLGIAYEAPLLDDHVINAVLSATYEARDTPLEWKPLMKEAMSGLLPNDYLKRTTKIGGAPQTVRGFAAHRESLTALWEDSGIFSYGILNKQLLHQNTQPQATATPAAHVSTQNNLALFLRGLNPQLVY